MAALAAVVAVVTLVTLAVGVLGLARIRKDRPRLKSYDLATMESDMGSDGARTSAAKTDSEATSDASSLRESHVRAGDEQDTLWSKLVRMLWQLTGFPLLTGRTTPDATMGNTATPTPAVLCKSETTSANSAEVDVLRDSKVATIQSDAPVPSWSDDESSSDHDDIGSEDDTQTDEEKFDELRAQIMLDGLQFYSAVATVSVATVGHAFDIALFRASTIVLRERRKAQEDASIQAIETLYPDIMCLPPGANARYAGPRKSPSSPTSTHSQAMSPRQLETRFLKAA